MTIKGLVGTKGILKIRLHVIAAYSKVWFQTESTAHNVILLNMVNRTVVLSRIFIRINRAAVIAIELHCATSTGNLEAVLNMSSKFTHQVKPNSYPFYETVEVTW